MEDPLKLWLHLHFKLQEFGLIFCYPLQYLLSPEGSRSLASSSSLHLSS